MKRCVLTVLILGLFAIGGYCQDNQPSADQNAAPQPPEISIYGEVKSVNTGSGSITVQYYDYDSDEEKSIEISVDNATKIENAAGISDVKQGNWADVIYSAAGGKNVAKSIIVEKEEEAPVEMPKSQGLPQEAPKQ